jgi:hypothetical protein
MFLKSLQNVALLVFGFVFFLSQDLSVLSNLALNPWAQVISLLWVP